MDDIKHAITELDALVAYLRHRETKEVMRLVRDALAEITRRLEALEK